MVEKKIKKYDKTELSQEVVEVFNDSQTVKMLTTTDEGGFPHTVCKGSLTVSEGGLVAYCELIETSQTQRNMLRNYWAKKSVAINLFNPRTGLSYQIKGIPYKFIVDGPIWQKFLKESRKMIPDADPSGVWLIIPKEARNQDYEVRRKEEAMRRPGSGFWLKYFETFKRG